MAEVTLNGQKYEVQRFKGLKAILIIAAITRLAREVPDVFARALREYQERNKVRITPELAKVRGYDLSEEDFKAGGGVVELPAVMDVNEQVMASLPDLLERARRPLFSLLAIMIADNEGLRAADKEGQDKVEAFLDEHYDELLDTDLDELAELALIGYETTQEQLSDKRDRLGKMFSGVAKIWRRSQIAQSTQDQAEELVSSVLSPTTSPPAAPSSSTDSEPPTDGPENTRSTTSPGTSSASSPS